MTRVHTRRRPARAAFTLTELMVAVVVLIGILLATSKIFSTTSKVTGMGEASASIMQEAAAIERQMREDIEHLARDGFFAIRNVAVPNNFYTGRLINPSLAPDAFVRADQLVFFRDGVTSVQSYRVGAGGNKQAQGVLSRVYYGHGFQLGQDAPTVDFSSGDAKAFDAAAEETVLPWTDREVQLRRVGYDGANDRYEESGSEILDVRLEDARRWLFARQNVMMVDDDRTVARGDITKTVYLSSVLAARSLFYDDPEIGFTPEIRNGRVEAAATEMHELRELLEYFPNGAKRPWLDQHALIAGQLMYYPRIEREAPSMHRVDHALTTSVMGSAVSAVRIEWTYDTGTGYFRGNGDGGICPFEYFGVGLVAGADPGKERAVPQPWFGMPDIDTGVSLYGASDAWYAEYSDDWTESGFAAQTIDPDNIERLRTWNGVDVYEAVFGPNESRALEANEAGCLVPSSRLGYTPWPSAIRVTLTLHDTSTRLEHGREVQFVIRLPKRAADAS